jgi:hypothetical protein
MLSGQYMESCNCDYLCPCIYTNPQGGATHDHCYAMMAFHIEKGSAEGVSLDGLNFALVIRSNKVMSQGDWIFAAVVDERAGEAQRTVLSRIVSGEAGGVPGLIRNNLVSDFRGVEFKPIGFTMDGLNRSTEIPGVFAFAIHGVPPRNNPNDAMHIDGTAHPVNRRLALAQADELRVEGFGLDLALTGQGNNGHYAPFTWAA